MNLFDIMGPIMVGPSSSHTAGAVRIGLITRKLLGEPVTDAEMLLHGSFAATGEGHGTDRALIAGLLGMNPDDENIPKSFEIAEKQGMKFRTGVIALRNVHPNTAMLRVSGKSGKKLEVVASSLGGGRIRICRIDGIETNFSGDCPTLIVHNLDQPGHVAQVTELLCQYSVNIAAMQLYRDVRGGYAVMVLECDQPIPAEPLASLARKDGIIKVTYLNLDE
ncbi:L-serine ammonia-lyase, iron-sulfur-dependent subunit beta [Caproicibacter sp.]|uniref:L-serine ammonia-lyase, iron-sulfur-dependent subunit beta n=1 Tax=Caproicibacter sp. TaxID=2814884 RepID=UPI003989E1D4